MKLMSTESPEGERASRAQRAGKEEGLVVVGGGVSRKIDIVLGTLGDQVSHPESELLIQ